MNRFNAPLQIGLIGAGRMGRSHAAAIASEPGARLSAIADPISKALAEELEVPHYVAPADLLATNPDAVIIATPNDQHVATALACIEAGIPVLLEKPVGVNLDEARLLARRVQELGVPVLVGHHRRHHPVVQAAKDVIAAGRLGDLVAINGLWLTRKPDDYFDSWRRSPGAGVLLINLVHDLDIFRYLFGEIDGVQAITSNRIRGFEVEDTAGLLLSFVSGAVGTLTGSDTVAAPWGWDQSAGDDPQFAQHPDQSAYTVAGTKGSLSIPQLNLWTYKGNTDWHHDLSMEVVPRAEGGALQRQLRHFITVARGQADPIVSVADAAKSLAAVEAVQQAAASGTRIEVTPLETSE
jgi:predicted dehydrogenase